MNFNSAANTDELHSDNKSSGWAVGVKVGVSASGGAGVSVFANVNKAKGNADGSSVTHTETQITATDRLNLNVGRDLNMTGTQARGNSVDATVGRNLTITSEQDSSDYESRQKSMSAGVEIPVYGAGSASANLAMSKQKIDSTYDSVNEQSGLFAGEGGSNVNVKGHTQLNGGTIASTADATRNNFSTGSLGFSNIENHAEYEASSSGMNFSTGGSMLSLAAQTLSSAIPANNGQSGESSSTTHASISAGNITIGGKEATAEQLNGLSRDTSDSANALKPIFDLQKVQDRMEMATVVGEIGVLATRITATALERAEQVAKDKALADAESKLTKEQKEYYDNNKDFKEHPELKEAWLLEQSSPSQTTALNNNPEYKALYDGAETAGDKAAIIDQMERKGLFGALAQANQLYLDDQKKHGPGSPYATAAQAISGLAVGIAGGNIQQGLSNAAAPYLAGVVGGYFDAQVKAAKDRGATDDEIAAIQSGRLLSHAAVGAAVAYASGGDAASGAAGAVAGEAMAMIVMELNYPGLTVDQLTNEQKEHIRAIATLASGLVGATVGNSFEAATTAAAAGYNASSNNRLGAVLVPSYSSSQASCVKTGNSIACEKSRELQTISYKDAGFMKNGEWDVAAIKEWQNFVTAQFEKEIYPLCNGNATCLTQARIDRDVLDVADAGNRAKFYQILGGLKAGYALQSGNWSQVASGSGLFAAMTLATNAVDWAIVRTGSMANTSTVPRVNPLPSLQQKLAAGIGLSESDLKALIPKGTPNGFRPSTSIVAGEKYNFVLNGVKYEIKYHAPDAVAAMKYPGSNSGGGWTAQIKIGNKYLGEDGALYNRPQNITHIRMH